MSRLDYLILTLLKQNEATVPVEGMTLQELAEEEGIGVKPITLYKRIKPIMEYGFMSKGIAVGRANSYYVTEAGLAWIEENKLRKVEKDD